MTETASAHISGDDKHLRILSTSDLAGIDISLADVVATVEGAYRTLQAGQSDNPRKLTVKPQDGHSVSYAMLGRDGSREVVAIKTSYKHGLDKGREEQHYYTALTIYDDVTGLPVAMMDCSRIGSLRTPAVSALLARELAAPGARTALVIGTGTQGGSRCRSSSPPSRTSTASCCPAPTRRASPRSASNCAPTSPTGTWRSSPTCGPPPRTPTSSSPPPAGTPRPPWKPPG